MLTGKKVLIKWRVRSIRIDKIVDRDVEGIDKITSDQFMLTGM